MSLANYGPAGSILTINARIITDFGENASPYTDSPIDPKVTLRRGQGGKALRLDRINPGRAVELYLNPGSPDSAYIQGLYVSGANITASWTQVGTLEAAIGTDGVIINDGPTGRAGTTITDDQYSFQFNGWTASKG